MMTLLGQHGQKQDYARGVTLIRQAANTADENAPQGAYVSLRKMLYMINSNLVIGLWHVVSPRAPRYRDSGSFLAS